MAAMTRNVTTKATIGIPMKVEKKQTYGCCIKKTLSLSFKRKFFLLINSFKLTIPHSPFPLYIKDNIKKINIVKREINTY